MNEIEQNGIRKSWEELIRKFRETLRKEGRIIIVQLKNVWNQVKNRGAYENADFGWIKL